MALLTVRAEPACVDIGLRVTAPADHRRLGDVLRPDMALRAADRGVCPRQREPCPRGMIKFAQVPAVRCVAAAAVLAQGAFMGILLRMAVVAITRCLAEMLVGMALTTGHRDMQPE